MWPSKEKQNDATAHFMLICSGKKINVAMLTCTLLHRESLQGRGETEQGNLLTIGKLQRHLCDYAFHTTL